MNTALFISKFPSIHDIVVVDSASGGAAGAIMAAQGLAPIALADIAARADFKDFDFGRRIRVHSYDVFGFSNITLFGD
jgi:hypothetical protein